MSYLIALGATVAVLLSLRWWLPQIPARSAMRAGGVDLLLLGLGVLGLVFHCGAMFFRSTFIRLPDSATAIHQINAMGSASKVWYAFPAVMVLAGLRHQMPIAVLAVALGLLAVGVTMYDAGRLSTHLAAIFLAVIVLAIVMSLLVIPSPHTGRSPRANT